MKTAEWTAALRSGDFKQTQRWLNSNGGFCCLGVLCEIKGLPKKDIDGEIGYVFEGKTKDDERYSHTVIPRPFEAQMLEDLNLSMRVNLGEGIEDSLAGVLMAMNDEGKSFNEIADYIDGMVANGQR